MNSVPPCKNIPDHIPNSETPFCCAGIPGQQRKGFQSASRMEDLSRRAPAAGYRGVHRELGLPCLQKLLTMTTVLQVAKQPVC